MSATKKELENVPEWAENFGLRFANVAGPMFRLLCRLGPIRRYFAGTIGGQTGVIADYVERGEHEKATDFAIEFLKKHRQDPESTWKVTHRDYWWLFMYYATCSVENCADSKKRDDLIELAKNGVEPLREYYAALSFLAFSRWKYEEEDFDTAIEFAKIAARADDSYGEPDFILGWYCLALGRGDALTHLAQAVQKDRSIFFRIANDPLCRQYPHIIQNLKRLSTDSIVTTNDDPNITSPRP